MPESTAAWGLRDVGVRFDGRTVLDNVTLPVTPGEVVAVVGGDGAGKTTALRVLTRRVEPGAGSVHGPGVAEIGYQAAASGTWAQLTVDENLDVVAGAYRLDRDRERATRARLLEASGLARARSRLASELSGGMRQKLGFCMAMLHEPALLVLDEPSTGIDPVSRVELWRLVSAAAADGAAVVVSTTYLDEAERVHHVLVLDAGVPLLSGTPAEVVVGAPGTVTAVSAAGDPARSWRRGQQLRQWHPGPARPGDEVVTPDMEDAVVAAALQRRQAGDQPGEPGEHLPLPRPRHRALDGELARADAVTRSFADIVAVEAVDLRVEAGEIVGLIGANGAGKTTLIRMLLGVLAPSAGAVRLFGQEPSRETRRRLGYVPQGLGLYGDLTLEENLAFVNSVYGSDADLPSVLRPRAADLTGAAGLGRQRQLAFTCALAHEPDLLVLDEPTSGVDPIARARLWDTVHEQADLGVGVLVSTHYMQEAEQCDRLVLMNLGRVVAAGGLDEIIGKTTAVQVETERWGAAFAALDSHGLPVSLSGTRVRVADTDPATVQSVLAGAQVSADVRTVRATLEETMTVISRGGPASAAS